MNRSLTSGPWGNYSISGKKSKRLPFIHRPQICLSFESEKCKRQKLNIVARSNVYLDKSVLGACPCNCVDAVDAITGIFPDKVETT